VPNESLRNWRELVGAKRKEMLTGLGRVPFIDDYLKAQLDRVEPSDQFELAYHPSRVQLTTGGWRDRVYVVEAIKYINTRGSWPWEHGGQNYQPLSEVQAIESSPTRLRARLATKIYAVGESGMGGVVFTLVTSSGRSLPYTIGGSAVDWVELPVGVSPDEIIDVITHDRGRPQEAEEIRGGAPYAWCLYQLPD